MGVEWGGRKYQALGQAGQVSSGGVLMTAQLADQVWVEIASGRG
jgi:hypothetical protein